MSVWPLKTILKHLNTFTYYKYFTYYVYEVFSVQFPLISFLVSGIIDFCEQKRTYHQGGTHTGMEEGVWPIPGPTVTVTVLE